MYFRFRYDCAFVNTAFVYVVISVCLYFLVLSFNRFFFVYFFFSFDLYFYSTIRPYCCKTSAHPERSSCFVQLLRTFQILETKRKKQQ